MQGTSALLTDNGRGTTIATSPPADRLPRRRWRDWRLMAGVLLVLGSVVLGARVVGAADDTVLVWAAAAELVEGTRLEQSDLVAVPVRIEASTNPYVSGPVPDGYVVVRAVGVGELVPTTAVAPAAQAALSSRLVAVKVAPESVPGPVAAGDHVDVWVVPDALSSPDDSAELLVAGVPVASVPTVDTSFGASSPSSTVVLSLDANSLSSLEQTTARLVAASAAGTVALTLDPTPR